MCISYPGRVLAVDGANAIVDTNGRQRRASTMLLPDAAAGDWVVVGAGSILRRLTTSEAALLIRTLDVAQGRAVASSTAQTIAQGGRS
ncbi:MAG TPA: HypC/HybG/HupF family hydrogenase formation chaperone [Candidatus Limnocylindrales bacterium]|jgi:hydrogenase assembly chaperone HypC/HupF|nr:HypC/HybG/HupF family hydrogenase formation chaperone [Candidatus Limnocylindrales bacterium]